MDIEWKDAVQSLRETNRGCAQDPCHVMVWKTYCEQRPREAQKARGKSFLYLSWPCAVAEQPKWESIGLIPGFTPLGHSVSPFREWVRIVKPASAIRGLSQQSKEIKIRSCLCKEWESQVWWRLPGVPPMGGSTGPRSLTLQCVIITPVNSYWAIYSLGNIERPHLSL